MMKIDCSPSRILVDPDEAPHMDPYGDISGIGVIIGFLGTAYIAAILVALNYLFAHDPQKNPFATTTGHSEEEEEEEGNDSAVNGGTPRTWSPNPIDMWFLVGFRKLLRIDDGRLCWTAQVFDECILTMCDIQLMTGFAILVSGFALSKHTTGPPLSAFHWLVLTSLAWFSCVTHLSGLTVLRSSLSRYRGMKLVRATLMFVLLLMVVVALVPTGYFNWYEGRTSAAIPQAPAGCYFGVEAARRLWRARCVISRVVIAGGGDDDGDDGDESSSSRHHDSAATSLTGCDLSADLDDHFSGQFAPPTDVKETLAMQSMELMVLLLACAFATRCFKLFEPLSRGWRMKVRSPCSRLAGKFFYLITPEVAQRTGIGQVMPSHQAKVPSYTRVWMDLVVVPLFSVFLFLRILADMFSSMLFEIFWVIFTLIWGTVKLDGILKNSAVPSHITDKEKVWTFGQIMAVMLAVSPVFTMVCKFIIQRTLSRNNKAPDLKSRQLDPGSERATMRHCLNRRLGGADTFLELNNAALDEPSSSDPPPIFLKRDYYTTASWISPFIASCLGGFLGIVLSIFLQTAARGFADPSWSLTAFWFSYYAMVIYPLFGYPISCAAIITIGIHADAWFMFHTVWKWCILCGGGLGYHALYILICYQWVGIVSHYQWNGDNDLLNVLSDTLLVAAMTYGLYAVCCGLRSAWRP